jgi:hypothetical protein
MQNKPFACGSSSTAARQALDKALDKTHQEQHKQIDSIKTGSHSDG